MNFLAHLYLARPRGVAEPAALVGALMPDLVRGPLPLGLPPAVCSQVRRHRRIDRATDAHPAFLEAAAFFRPRLGRFAGIAADVCLDAALCRAWPGLHPLPLEEAIRRYHGGLYAGRGHMPPRMRAACRRMLRQGWLLRYASRAGLLATFGQMSGHFAQRLHRPVDLTPAAEIATEHAADLDRLLPELMARLQREDVLGEASAAG
ncbi:ACP phosphodiesterase [Phycisphaera mikurensis]|uniref:Acyl carrier protein phosphodiesterase n=1 Tax=Phycisphaera mikurensis (strain NBRC 102666 / KCTC 22515 / FYK2301M01) TaxID=1142394 RepID=I0IEW1_PHYMF|nr:ACP phosphodiesterase [Phycisphaera mikurensis]MBB6441594.1 acyl carrier protein phosphodiesterase [Phycisphaera mikurensis]BAM03799.1 acyl carrier protein phosphodiesterase [Phycisphaera mikurensis NBRC 102666]